MLATPGCGLRRLIAATERSELPSGLNANEKFDRIPDQGLRVKMCVWLGVSRGLDLAFLNAD